MPREEVSRPRFKDCPRDLQNNVCGNRGQCDDTKGICNCNRNWQGDVCDECAFGYYGYSCSMGAATGLARGTHGDMG